MKNYTNKIICKHTNTNKHINTNTHKYKHTNTNMHRYKQNTIQIHTNTPPQTKKTTKQLHKQKPATHNNKLSS